MKKKLMAIITAAILLVSIAVPASAAEVSSVFTDVKAGSWYNEAAQYAFDNGLFNGTSKTAFSPNASMTRAMFVTVLGRSAGVVESAYPGTQFSDVKESQYYAAYVQWAASQGVVNGTGKGKFSPNASITREEMATILYRYIIQVLQQTSGFPNNALEGYADAGHVSGWAGDAMKWSVTHGLIKGTTKTTLAPTVRTTRAECAQILMNAKDFFTMDGKKWYAAEYKYVEHPAETEQVWVVDKKGYSYPVGLEDLQDPVVLWHDDDGSVADITQSPKESLRDIANNKAYSGYYQVYEQQYRTICNDCGADITGNAGAHVENHLLNDENAKGSYHVEVVKVQTETKTIIIPEEGHYETKFIKSAWTEKVIIRQAGWY